MLQQLLNEFTVCVYKWSYFARFIWESCPSNETCAGSMHYTHLYVCMYAVNTIFSLIFYRVVFIFTPYKIRIGPESPGEGTKWHLHIFQPMRRRPNWIISLPTSQACSCFPPLHAPIPPPNVGECVSAKIHPTKTIRSMREKKTLSPLNTHTQNAQHAANIFQCLLNNGNISPSFHRSINLKLIEYICVCTNMNEEWKICAIYFVIGCHFFLLHIFFLLVKTIFFLLNHSISSKAGEKNSNFHWGI